VSNTIYELDGKPYDVSKLDADSQSLFSLLVTTKQKADEHREQLIILTEAYTSFANRLNTKCKDYDELKL